MYGPSLAFGFLVAICIWYVSKIYRNYLLARKTGLPLYISPIYPANPVWVVFSATFQPQLEKFLPRVLYDRVKASIFGWEFRERWNVNEKLGSSYVLVTPGQNEVWIADPDMATEVLQRRNDFLQLEIATKIMSYYGMNLSARHRRIVAPVLNERIMSAVWTETTRQTQEMLDQTLPNVGKQCSYEDRKDTIGSLRQIAINVMGSVVYGNHVSWQENPKSPTKSLDQLSFSKAMLEIVNNHIVAVLVPIRLLTSKHMPQVMQRIGYAVKKFKSHTQGLIHQQRHGNNESNTLISTLVRVADNSSNVDKDKKSALHLSDDEITGNLFNFTIAGFDTNASTMAYAILALALEPKWQEWIIEEIDAVNTQADDSIGDYEDTFHLLPRCLALMFETLRMYTPVARITRRTAAAQSLSSALIPANTDVYLAPGCIHVAPSLWGPDPLTFRPTRWLSSESGIEKIIDFPKGTFLPWSSGPRSCPGMRMSQVEFVAMIKQVFQTWRLEVAPLDNENMDESKERLKSLIKRSQPKITLQLREPEKAGIRWIKRSPA